MQMSLPKTSVVSYEYKNPVQAYAKHTAGVNWRPPLNVRLKGTPVVNSAIYDNTVICYRFMIL